MPRLEVVVYDADSGRPVGFGVMVVVENTNIHQVAVTDINGVARFALPPGTYHITAGGGAFDLEKRTITLDRDKRVRIVLKRVLL